MNTNREKYLESHILNDEVKEVDMGSFGDIPDLKKQSYQWYIVREDEVGRADLISYRIYNSSIYWWILLKVNGIADPWHDLAEGVALKAYPKKVLIRILNELQRG